MAKRKGLGNPALMALASDKTSQRILVGGAVLVGGFVIYKGFQLGTGVLESLGLKDDKEDKANAALIDNAAKYLQFDPTYWKRLPTGSIIYSTAGATVQAKKINDAFGYINDDEEAIYNVFRSARSKGHASIIAYEYSALFNADLFETLKARLSVSEMATVIKITESKPTTVRS